MTSAAVKPSEGVSLRELSERLAAFGAVLSGDGTLRVSDVREDSRLVSPGSLFAARAGRSADGVRFVEDALRRGAKAVLANHEAELPTLPVPVIRVRDVAFALGAAAEVVHGDPSRSLAVVGVTGTNGKTTTAFLLEQALSGPGHPAARLGTLGYSCGDDRVEETLTTPSADDVSRFMARARDRGAGHFVMEVSSHALDQHRVDAIGFSAAAFTNLTQDHLDYHASMRDYGEAKARLFTELSPGVSVINVDDAFGKALVARCPGAVVTVGRGQDASVHPDGAVADANGVHGRISVAGGSVELSSRLVGQHNVDNLLLVLGVVSGLGLDVTAAAQALSRASGVPGRLERCDGPEDDVLVLVDYAHTPDALYRVLEAVRPLTDGRVVCVFGCGGDRDPGKRPKMGDAVGRGADRAIVTNDNPRSETPEAIADAILTGLRPHGIPFEVELNRASAIDRAIFVAEKGDVVLIAGKGHEPYQIVGKDRRPFDDRVEARRALAARRGKH